MVLSCSIFRFDVRSYWVTSIFPALAGGQLSLPDDGAVIFLLNAKIPFVLAGWCYGPRYMLRCCTLEFPFIQTLTIIATSGEDGGSRAGRVMALLLLFSLRLQLNVNALSFAF